MTEPSNDSACTVGNPIVLVTEGTNNHSPEKWANATAQMIFVTSYLEGVERQIADRAQNLIANTLVPLYQSVIVGNLARAETVITEIRAALEGTRFEAFVNHPGWADEAAGIINGHLETAIHVQNMINSNKGIN